MLIHIHLLLIPLVLSLSALFASAEAALFSLTRSQLEALEAQRPGIARKIKSLVFQPDELLSTIIIGNECLNIMLGMFVTGLLLDYFPQLHLGTTVVLSVFISSALLLTVSEILPKVIAFRMPMLIASVLAYPLSGVHWLVTPLRKIFLGVSRKVLKVLGIQVTAPSAVSEKDFLTLVEVGAESGSLDRDEKELIQNVFHFSDLSVGAVMTPWDRVLSLPDNLSPAELLEAVRKHPFSRIPVTNAAKDQVRGILFTKGLLKLLVTKDDESAREIIRASTFPPYIVSSHKKIARLFGEFKLKKVHMALVVDEFGRHLGVVTLEDVLSALFKTQKRTEAPA